LNRDRFYDSAPLPAVDPTRLPWILKRFLRQHGMRYVDIRDR
jgi:hypothetical protein